MVKIMFKNGRSLSVSDPTVAEAGTASPFPSMQCVYMHTRNQVKLRNQVTQEYVHILSVYRQQITSQISLNINVCPQKDSQIYYINIFSDLYINDSHHTNIFQYRQNYLLYINVKKTRFCSQTCLNLLVSISPLPR